jgi:hypothetical protein
VGPDNPPYPKLDQAVDPFPILNKLVLVSIPISPDARVGLAEVHSDAVPRRN